MACKTVVASSLALLALTTIASSASDYYFRVTNHTFGKQSPATGTPGQGTGSGTGGTGPVEEVPDTTGEGSYGENVRFLSVAKGNSGQVRLAGTQYPLRSIGWDVDGLPTDGTEDWEDRVRSVSADGRTVVYGSDYCSAEMKLVPSGAAPDRYSFTVEETPGSTYCGLGTPVLGMKLVDSVGVVDRWTSDYVVDRGRTPESYGFAVSVPERVDIASTGIGTVTAAAVGNLSAPAAMTFDPTLDGKTITCGVSDAGTCRFSVAGSKLGLDIISTDRVGRVHVDYELTRKDDLSYQMSAKPSGDYRLSFTTVPGILSTDAAGKKASWQPRQFLFDLKEVAEPVRPTIATAGAPVPSIAVDGGSDDDPPVTVGPYAQSLTVRSRLSRLYYRFRERNEDFFTSFVYSVDPDDQSCVPGYYEGYAYPVIKQDRYLTCSISGNNRREGPITKLLTYTDYGDGSPTHPVGGYFLGARLANGDDEQYDGVMGPVSGDGWLTLVPTGQAEDGSYLYDGSFLLTVDQGNDDRRGMDDACLASVRHDVTGSTQLTLQFSEVPRDGPHVLDAFVTTVSNGKSTVGKRQNGGKDC